MQSEQIFLTIFLALCVLPIVSMLVIVAIIFVLGRRFWQKSIDPNVDRLLAQYDQLRQTRPDEPAEKHMKAILHQEAIKCGIIGAITGLGGFFTLPIALPIDLILSMRLQVAMVQFVARAYGFSEDQKDSQWATYMVMSRSGEVTRMSVDLIMRYALNIIGKSFSKLIPFLGAFISFIVNYTIARSTAHIAQTWYQRRTAPPKPHITTP